jgi:hypothetical protein
MLFKVEHGKDVFKLNPEALAIEEFKNMTPKMFTCLILFADYKSPFRQKPIDIRFKLAAMQSGYKIDSSHHTQIEKRARELFAGDNKYWEAGYKKYMEIQHNEDLEMLEIVEAQLNNIRTVLKTTSDDVDELKKRSKLLEDLPTLLETKRRVARLLDMEAEVMGTIESEEEKPRALSLVDRISEENGL